MIAVTATLLLFFAIMSADLDVALSRSHQRSLNGNKDLSGKTTSETIQASVEHDVSGQYCGDPTPGEEADAKAYYSFYTSKMKKPQIAKIWVPSQTWKNGVQRPVDGMFGNIATIVEFTLVACGKQGSTRVRKEKNIGVIWEEFERNTGHWSLLADVKKFLNDDDFSIERLSLVLPNQADLPAGSLPVLRTSSNREPDSRIGPSILINRECSPDEGVDQPCCLATVEFDLNLTDHIRGRVVSPGKIPIHYCKGDCSHQFAGIKTSRDQIQAMIEGVRRPVAGDRCCSPAAFSPILATIDMPESGRRQINLDQIDASACICLF